MCTISSISFFLFSKIEREEGWKSIPICSVDRYDEETDIMNRIALVVIAGVLFVACVEPGSSSSEGEFLDVSSADFVPSDMKTTEIVETECAVHVDCDDGDSCTMDKCKGGMCDNKLRPNCTTTSECAYEANATPCTEGVCSNAMCVVYSGPGKPECVTNDVCYGAQQVCFEFTCAAPIFSDEVGDGNVCTANADCATSVWGPYCILSSASLTGGYCQECTQQDENDDGAMDGCVDGIKCFEALWSWPEGGSYTRPFYYCSKSSL